LTDHSARIIAMRMRPTAARKCRKFEKCPFGITGLETALGLALEVLFTPAKSRFDR